MIDSHAHVHDKRFDGDRPEMLERAKSKGVEAIVTVGCDMEDTARAIACANEHKLYASAGIHPHEAKDAPADLASAFEAFLAETRVVAIGETGLDYYYGHSPREAQIAVMRAHIRLAKDRDLPVIFHHRDAYDDFVAVLREEFTPGMRGVIHCFTGDTEQAKTYTGEFGLKLGIGGVLTFKTAQSLRDAVTATGIDHCILETDCPYLAPVPHRGDRNEPAYMQDTAVALAALLEMPVDSAMSRTSANAQSLFKITPESF